MAFEYFTESTEVGHIEADFQLGYLYMFCMRIDKNEDSASGYYGKQALDNAIYYNIKTRGRIALYTKLCELLYK